MNRKLSVSIIFALLIVGFVPFNSFLPSVYAVSATGGTITYVGDYTIHTFTTSGTFTVTSGGNVDYLVVGGGGGGGGTIGGGGGAGGFRNGTGFTVTAQAYTITIGAGGAGGFGDAAGSNGNDSIFSTITAVGGGGGGGGSGGSFTQGKDGGSGGGGSQTGGGGNPSSGQGSGGGDGHGAGFPAMAGGGGGGAGGNGTNASANTGGAGGNGLSTSISGTSVLYAGGGGGVGNTIQGAGKAGGGTGGGQASPDATNASANSGSGGGGAKINGGADAQGGNGGSGIVIIRYVTEPNVYADNVNIEIIGDAAKLTGIVNMLNGSLANVTSVSLIVNGTTVNTNNTGQNGTAPYSFNIGPLWYQMITDQIYEFEIETTTQFSNGISTNSTLFYALRDYAPDYFTAIDPTQGQVNYTFVDGNFINVNRDTSSIVFNIECQYFTQAQAFFNELENGVWDNETNVLFYVGDTTDYYYVQCFNDGELFVTAISQNFSNALVPGLVIFDQLGGFFGAPSIILVIISILSLGTGRNYPIIMLIAASVTGILLALELLTLDPGIVVAIIVMTGIGLYGIRKFY